MAHQWNWTSIASSISQLPSLSSSKCDPSVAVVDRRHTTQGENNSSMETLWLSLTFSYSLAHTYQRDEPSLVCTGFHVGCVLVLPLNWTALWNHSDSRCESRCDCCDCLWINDAFVMNWQPVPGVSCPVHYGTHSSVLFGISTLQSVWIHPHWQDEFIHTLNFSR